jgi:hypothetical protein
MKSISNYQQAKETLKNEAETYKKLIKFDNPRIRMNINDDVDYLSKDLNLSEHQRSLLSNYACKLHPKN